MLTIPSNILRSVKYPFVRNFFNDILFAYIIKNSAPPCKYTSTVSVGIDVRSCVYGFRTGNTELNPRAQTVNIVARYEFSRDHHLWIFHK